MKATRRGLIRLAITAPVLLALATSSVQEAEGRKPVREPHRYRVTVSESLPASPVFWDADAEITGRIAYDGDPWLLVNQNVVSGINPYANWGNLDPLFIDASCVEGPWSVCFADEVNGTVLIPADGATQFRFQFTALNRNNKSLWYNFVADAEPSPTADLYSIGIGESVTLELTTWTLAAGTGPMSKGCIGCGDFAGAISVTVERLSDTYPDDQ